LISVAKTFKSDDGKNKKIANESKKEKKTVSESILPLNYSSLVYADVYMKNLNTLVYFDLSNTTATSSSSQKLFADVLSSIVKEILEKASYYSTAFVIGLFLQLVSSSTQNCNRSIQFFQEILYSSAHLMNAFEKLVLHVKEGNNSLHLLTNSNSFTRKLIETMDSVFQDINPNFYSLLQLKQKTIFK
jgi:hypothetical protein